MPPAPEQLPPHRTPFRTNATQQVRCDTEIWADAQGRARTDNLPMAAVVGLLLWQYAAGQIDLPDIALVPPLAHYAPTK